MSRTSLMSASDTGLLVIDVQEKLMPMISGKDRIVRNISFLLQVARLMGVPIQATEQYAKGLGSTVSELVPYLPPRPDKVVFSCCAVPEVLERFRQEQRHRLLLAGIEAHVCVQQTALELLEHEFQVYVAADAVGSRFDEDRKYALRRMEQAGVILTTAEAAAFEWVRRAGTPEFKTFSKLVQERSAALKTTS